MQPVYSPLCQTDRQCYLSYLRAFVQDGKYTEHVAGDSGCSNSEQFNCCSNHPGLSVNSKCIIGGVEASNSYVGCNASNEFSCSESHPVNSSIKSTQRGWSSTWRVASDSTNYERGCSCGHVCNESVPVAGFESHSKNRNGEVEIVGERIVEVEDECAPQVDKRQRNRERNKARKERRAMEKAKIDEGVVKAEEEEKRKKNFFISKFSKKDWRSTDGGDMIEQNQSPGTFWNSTSKQVRQELIDSKAKMHIAENKRREREALDKIAYLESPEAAMHKAIGMIDYAQKQAKKENDNKVYGWAKTVATSSAESLARSTPDSVPSFDEVSARIEASSQSSFELELKAKQDELDDERRKNALLENEIREEKKAKEEVVAKSKHEAVVHRMRQLETQISENNKKAERVNFRRNRVEEMRNAQGETEKQMRARMAKLSPEEHQREVVRLMRERAWENS